MRPQLSLIRLASAISLRRDSAHILYDPAGPVSVAVEIKADAFLDHMFETVYGESLTAMSAGAMPGEVRRVAAFG